MSVWVDTIPNTHCLRLSEDELPKKIGSLIEEGCPNCKTWDHLEDVHEKLTLQYTNFREAREKGPIEYPGAIFLKALMASGADNKAYRVMKDYVFVI